MKKILTIISMPLLAGLLFATSCTKPKDDMQPSASYSTNTNGLSERQISAGAIIAPLQMKVYYDNVLFKVLFEGYSNNFTVTPSTDALKTVNTLYVYKEYVSPGIFPPQFTPVLSALPRTGLTPSALWQKVIITFPASKPYQIYSAEEINKLLSTSVITATKTTIFYEMALSKDQPAAIQ